MAHDRANVTVTSKHKYPMGVPDAKGDRKIFVTGIVTMITATGISTTTEVMKLDLSADIPTVEGVIIQGDGGYIVQYDYSTTEIEIYRQDSSSDGALTEDTTTSMKSLVFRFFAWGY